MYHLTPEELLDLAEATRPEVSSKSMSHLAACAVCRDQLADLRAALELVDPADVHVPEPSPLFWEHFSTRASPIVEGTMVVVEDRATGGRVPGRPHCRHGHVPNHIGAAGNGANRDD
jgi:hypothetical protein